MLRLKAVLLTVAILVLFLGVAAHAQVTPTALTYFATPGGSDPAPQTLAINPATGGSISGSSSWTVTVSDAWLSASPASGSGQGSTTISVKISGIPAGTFTGHVYVQFGTATPKDIPVTLNLNGISFTGAVGGAATTPASATIAVSVSGGGSFSTNWTAAVSTDNGVQWLSISPTSGSAAGSITVKATIGSLTAGTYTGKVTLTNATPATTPVTLVVNAPKVATLVINPSTLLITAAAGSLPAPRTIQVSAADGSAAAFTAVATSTGGSWLTVTPASGTTPAIVSVSVNPAGLASGTYSGQVAITPSGGTATNVSVSLTVSAAPASALAVSPKALKLETTTGTTALLTGFLTVSNPGVTDGFTATASSAGNWLTISSATGTTPATLTVSANPAGLAAGVYQGTVKIADASSSFSVPVVFIIDSLGPTIQLNQTSFTFSGVAGGEVTAGQQLRVLNSGSGTLAWTLAISGGASWLTADLTSGSTTSDPATVTPVNLTANPAGLAAGTYYATVTIGGTASNSPAAATVVFTVNPAAGPANLVVNPGGLVFLATEGGSSPTPRTIAARNTGGGTLAVTATAFTSSGGSWLAVSGSGNAPATLTVTPTLGTLKAGAYLGQVAATGGGTSATVTVLLIVRPAGTAITVNESGIVAAGCASSAIYAVSTTLPDGFSARQGAATPISVQAVDNCGAAVVGASAIATFSSTDNPVTLASNADGSYSATWFPQSSGQVSVAVAISKPPLTSTTVNLSGNVAAVATPDAPSIGAGGVVNGASFAAGTPVAAGSIITVFGKTLLSAAVTNFPTIPGVTVTIGGVTAPLYYADAAQVNAQVPFEVAGKTAASVVLNNNGKLSTPEPLVIGATQPGLFLYYDGTIQRGAILDANFSLITTANPAVRGNVIQIYATGLGAVDQTVKTGALAPSNPVANVTGTVQVSIGGQPATVQFKGLAPGFAGLYQVNVNVPTGISAGDQPLIITMNNMVSNTVILAVK